MPNPENLRPFTSENQPDTASKSRKGIPNGSTVARIVLSMAYETPSDIHANLLELYPDLPKKTSIEFVGALQQAHKMITERDTNAYKALHERAYGAPKQEIEQTVFAEKQPSEMDNGELAREVARILNQENDGTGTVDPQ